jgi:hypothetical protein
LTEEKKIVNKSPKKQIDLSKKIVDVRVEQGFYAKKTTQLQAMQ